MSFEQCTNEFSCARTRRLNLRSLSLGVSRINHIHRMHGHTILQEKRAAEIDVEVGQRSPERLFRDSGRTVRSKRHSVRASQALVARQRGTSLAQHILEHSLQPNRASWR